MNKTQILIVEDEGLVAKDLQAMLRRLGYHVPVTVGTGELAVATALQNGPDLILMDIQLRGAMDGVQAAEAITAERDIPILYLTANSDESTFQRAKDTDPFGFLVKPFEERSLQAGIEMAIYKHRAETRSREREQWLATTLGSIADAVITTDRLGKVTFLNSAAEKLSGWEAGDAAGLSYDDVFRLIPANASESPNHRVAAALQFATTADVRNPALLRRRDDSEVTVEYSVAPIQQGVKEEIGGCVIVFSDITERMQLEEKLRQAQKMDAIGKLAGGIAHDFNNAITAIIGYAELILRETGPAVPLYKNAKQIVRAAEHSARLTHQLLAFSRKQVLQPRCIDLQEQILEVEGMVRRLIGENIALQTEILPGLWSTLADAGQMHQVVLNMAINARDAMPQGGRLKLRLSNATVSATEALRIPEGRPGEFVLLEIQDSGIGMSDETQRRIFEPFFTTKEPGKGTGLGLATCYGIIKQTAGMVAVSSELGVGTTFSIYLPKADRAEQRKPIATAADEIIGGTETILVVEDEEILRELAVEVLESLGYEIIAAADGVEATEILRADVSGKIDLVVTDLVMPRMSGRELIAWIGERFENMRVLFMSGYTDDEIIRTAVEGAEVQYLQKPFTPKALAQKIRGVFDAPALCTLAGAGRG